MKGKLILILWTTLLVSTTKAQSVSVDAKIEPLEIRIGEQAKMQLQVSLDAAQHLVLPAFADTIIPGIEVVDVAKPDTQFLNERRRMVVTQEYTITSFDSAFYSIPPLDVIVDKKNYQSDALALKVISVPVDTLHPEKFYGQKAIMKPPFVFGDWAASIVCAFLVFPLLGLIIYLIIRICDNKPIIRKIKVEQKLPPDKVALSEIEKIKNAKIWQKGLTKDYYTELTDVVRQYIKERFGFNALEMTSSEIIDKLLEVKDKEAISDLKFLFQTADLVKFAKHAPLINENDANLLSAIDFINDTKIEESEAVKNQPTEITVVEKRTLRTKIILVTGIICLSIAFIWALVYAIRQFYNFLA